MTQALDMLKGLAFAHKVILATAAAILAMASFAFFQWVATPSYTILYSGLAPADLAPVIQQLEADSVAYKVEGDRLMVPRVDVYKVRASLAEAGVRGAALPSGYELLDNQGLSLSDFRQRIDYQRALEGEIARTLLAMDDITTATVHLVLPDKELFAENQQPVTASVLVDSRGELGELKVETITSLVAASVEGLAASDVTVAHTSGRVLSIPGDDTGSRVRARNLAVTTEYEAALASDLTGMLNSVLGPNRASVVVRATLDLDERSVEQETINPDRTTPIAEHSVTETYEGSGTAPAGALGVDGGEAFSSDGSVYTYDRTEDSAEYAVTRTITSTVQAPGTIEKLSVAVALDDGSLSGADTPSPEQIESLVAAAIGLNPGRGDTVAVSALPFPVIEGETVVEEPASSLMSYLPQAIGALVLAVVAIGLLLMTRNGHRPAGTVQALESDAPFAIGPPTRSTPLAQMPEEPAGTIDGDVLELVQRQPEEIAGLLRSWLADRREVVR